MEKQINRKELSDAVAKEFVDLKKKDVEGIVTAVFEEIKRNLAEGKNVQINAFGTFRVSQRKQRNGVNPQTKEKMVHPAHKTVTLKVTKALKEAVN